MATKAQTRSRAKKLLKLFGTDGLHWAKDNLAYDTPRGNDDADSVHPNDPNAQSWCLLGGMEKLQINETWLQEIIENDQKVNEGGVSDFCFQSVIQNFNDSHTWPKIRNFLSRLIHNPVSTEAR